ncbi:MAG: septum formation protein Maf [Opitutaceae bacterium]|nr:septum formation protein Maf [Verrucomicrobiales bacterium]
MKLPPIILASVSPRRSELLREMGVEFQVVPSDAAEIHNEHLTAREICQINAYRKARVIAKRYPDMLVIGADTLVCLGVSLFGKPRDLRDAERMLAGLSGKTHQVVTGVCLIHLRAHRQRIFADTTDVTFRALSTEQIRDYLAKISPLDKAGAYAIQDHGAMIVERIDGSYSNVVGLPVERLSMELEGFRNGGPR